MAIYHMNVSMISRSAGRSSTAAAAYRAGERILDERQGLEFDYARRAGVLSAEILLPEGAPEQLRDRVTLWNAVEQGEKRKDAQLAREVTVALPNELTEAQRGELVRGFVQDRFVAKGMIADIAIHAPGKDGDQRNHHAHIMLTTRVVTADGFGGKERAWNDRGLLVEWREAWADHANAYLREIGAGEIDHRSLDDQRDEKLAQRDAAERAGDGERAAELGIEAEALNREPLPDMGWKAWGMMKRGIETGASEAWREVKAQTAMLMARVDGLRQQFAKIYGRVLGVFEKPDDRLAAEVRAHGFSRIADANADRDKRVADEAAALRKAEAEKITQDREDAKAKINDDIDRMLGSKPKENETDQERRERQNDAFYQRLKGWERGDYER